MLWVSWWKRSCVCYFLETSGNLRNNTWVILQKGTEGGGEIWFWKFWELGVWEKGRSKILEEISRKFIWEGILYRKMIGRSLGFFFRDPRVDFYLGIVKKLDESRESGKLIWTKVLEIFIWRRKFALRKLEKFIWELFWNRRLL